MRSRCAGLIKGDHLVVCGRCGNKVKVDRTLNTALYEDVDINERNLVLLSNDDPTCAGYHGKFQAAAVHVVGQGTEFERIFLRSLYKQAEDYARAYGVKVGRLISVRSLCHETVVAALGA